MYKCRYWHYIQEKNKSNQTWLRKKKTSLSWQPFNETTGREKVDQAKLREAYQQDCLDKWKGYF